MMYFKFGQGEVKALSFCVVTTVTKHSDQLSSPKVNVQTAEPQPKSNTRTRHVTHIWVTWANISNRLLF